MEKKVVKNYIEGNLEIINYYSKLYEEQIDVREIFDIVNNSRDLKIDLTNFQRFRIFLDSCLLLWNREKLEKEYFQRKFVYQDFFDEFENEEWVKMYAEHVTQNLFPEIDNKINGFYYSCDGEKKSVYKQVRIVRNGLAHMQYGHYCSLENGLMVAFGLYNKDKGIRKEIGYVLEPVFHEFVKSYYSNYTNIGVPFKHTLFSNNSLKSGVISQDWYFQEVLFNGDEKKYRGNSNHKMNELTAHLSDFSKLKDFLSENESIFEINESKLSEVIDKKSVRQYVRENIGYENFELFFQTAKFILDSESEISNFLVHLNQLNDRICDYLISRNSGELDKNRKEQLLNSIAELEEDKPAFLTFKKLFGLLKLMNVLFRLQDDDYNKIEVSRIDMSKFIVTDYSKIESYINKKKAEGEIPSLHEKVAEKYYILERVRNAVMHGHIKVEINEKNKLVFIFSDKYNNRCETIKIESKDLNEFSNQKLFYTGLPNTVLLANKNSSSSMKTSNNPKLSSGLLSIIYRKILSFFNYKVK